MTLSRELWGGCLAKQPSTQRSQVCQSALLMLSCRSSAALQAAAPLP